MKAGNFLLAHMSQRRRKLPTVTSNVVSPFFCHACCLCIRIEFLACMMMLRSSFHGDVVVG